MAADGAPAVDTATGRVMIDLTTKAKAGQKVVVGVRPSDLVVDDAGTLSAKAVLQERLGHDAQLFCDGPEGRFLAVIDKAAHYPEGSTVRFSIAPSKVHVFDAQSEVRI